MKICSLLPSATEIVFALGLGDSLVAVTHECNYPPAAATRLRVTSTPIHPGMSSQEIDDLVMASVAAGESLYQIDLGALARLEPDLILTQQLCEVCAISEGEVRRALKTLPSQPKILNLEPRSLAGILENIIDVGNATGKQSAAAELVRGLEGRIESVRARAAGLARPRVFCMEWADPPFCGGHWMKELVDIAGGRDDLSRLHQPSTRVEWSSIIEFAPEVVVLTCCGFDVPRAMQEVKILESRAGFHELSAVRAGRVYVAHAMAYFSRPGPRIVDSLEILAHLIHPDVFPDPAFVDAFATADLVRQSQPA